MILFSDKSSECNLSCFFDIKKPRRIEHLQSEEPFSSDPYFSDQAKGLEFAIWDHYLEQFIQSVKSQYNFWSRMFLIIGFSDLIIRTFMIQIEKIIEI